MINNLLSKDCLKIIQITDAHLFGNDGEKLFGYDPNKNFSEVVQRIKRCDLINTDFIILTGDLSQDETANSYLNLMQEFSGCTIPIYWIPGNHDDIGKMSAIFSKSSFFSHIRSLSMKYWNFVFLNTKMMDSESGYLNENEIHHLEMEINNARLENKKLVIIMHHHPVQVESPLIDNYTLNNKKMFWDTVRKIKGGGVIICGHVHGDYSFTYKNFKIECSPATCFQFKKGSVSLEIDNLIGYKIHNFKFNDYSSYPVIWKK